MSDSGATPATEVNTPPSTPKKTARKTKETKKERAKLTHPKTADMVTAAIRDLKERGGSSLQAIKKYIATNYKVDAEKLAPFIRKYLKAAVTSGTLVQTKGKGASGSFKLAAPTGSSGEKKVVKKEKVVTASPGRPKKAKAPAGTMKKAAVKKQPATKKAGSPKKAAVKAKEKKAAAASPKAKKAAKVPTKKPKSPKPKKVVAKPKAGKKATAKK